mmetsp:Transcript_11816/g.19972  ORF Transcript_11816/g.19972 Transcript_11816/m.19972 type:complete len:147 (-) Transcript_11816:89-529(-)|eukprot:CAMPEP_0168614926 /NCGR_PEP_ID=MMETSP0449_2-20121227/4236_1 /TAXON_ID=1082188 /ORGANISM="Strombidium rassoulzadegani, Strain ras09" /LENGTH=146 /DNA_ID=CAMNT_0008655641 /DNA_START=617 /DNA_END=1057 /DNA_ORIENTATION=-
MNLLTSDVQDEFIPDAMLVDSNQEMSSVESPAKKQQDTLNLVNNVNSMTVGQIIQSMQGPMYGMFKNIIAGKYTYLTYLMCSSACVFFWMTPNHYKVKLIRPRQRKEGETVEESKKKSKNEIVIKNGRKTLVIDGEDVGSDVEMEF